MWQIIEERSRIWEKDIVICVDSMISIDDDGNYYLIGDSRDAQKKRNAGRKISFIRNVYT